MAQNRIVLFLIGISSVFIAIGSYRFAFLDLNLAFADMTGHIDHRRILFLLHISLAPVALVLGAYQMVVRPRGPRGALHRWIGRGYGMAIAISGVAGLALAIGADGGAVAGVGFGLLSVLWVSITANAVRLAVVGRYSDHRRWMIRSFALTFAGVTLRLYLLGFMFAEFSYTEASVYLAWLCWVPNLIFAEWMLRRR